MAFRLVASKTWLQKFLETSSRQGFAVSANRGVCSGFIDHKLITTVPIRGSTVATDISFVECKRRKSSAKNNCIGSANFSTRVTPGTAMEPPPNDEETNGKSSVKDNEDGQANNEQPRHQISRPAFDDEDKYCVEIKDGFMKVSMKPLSTTGADSMESRGQDIHSSTPKLGKETDPDSSNNQDAGRESQTRIPETVLQFQRQLRKTQAAKRASTPLDMSQLQIVYDDEHIVVVNKPSGVLTVPGINSNPSMLTVLYEKYKSDLDPEMKPEHMIVHRLDMDTSGIVVYAKSKKNLLTLQALFRNRDEVSKSYEAVVCGHVHPDVQRGSIDLPLQRDHRFPPFMRVATPRSEREAQEVVKDLKKHGFKKLVKKKAKPSQTLFEVIGREYRTNETAKDAKAEPYPVTRLRLTLLTGRTHQLRVHCASIGHPILGDPAYGIYGEASPNGGFEDALMDELVPARASVDLQLALDQYVKDRGQVMCLHARELRVKHPETGEPLIFEQPPAF